MPEHKRMTFDPDHTYVLDGATGTELGSRGIDIGLPLWSANALLHADGRTVLRQIHADYVAAGADVLTANTFRCHRRSLDKAGLGNLTYELIEQAVTIARDAANDSTLVAGSMSPLEDCYRPDLVPPDEPLVIEHAEIAGRLAQAGCDLLLVETMNTVREALRAARAAAATGLPTIVTFVCGADTKLLSGETLGDAIRALAGLDLTAVGVNCVPAPRVADCLSLLPADLPRIAFANIGEALPDGSWAVTDAVEPDVYADHAAFWDARIVGGCCGTTPAHISRLAEVVRSRSG